MFQAETTYRTADELGYLRDLAGRGHWPRLAAYHRLVAEGWRTYDGPGMAVDRAAVLAEMERLLAQRLVAQRDAAVDAVVAAVFEAPQGRPSVGAVGDAGAAAGEGAEGGGGAVGAAGEETGRGKFLDSWISA